MKRRQFITLMGGAAVALPLTAPRTLFAQKPPVIGWLWFSPKDAPNTVNYLGQFLAGMRELAHVEGQDFEMLYRFADFDAARMPQLAAELVQFKPDVIVGGGTLNAVALKKSHRHDSHCRSCARRSG